MKSELTLKDLEGKTVYWTNKWDKLWLLIIPLGMLIETLLNLSKYNTLNFWLIVIGAGGFTGYVLYHIFHPKFIWIDASTTKGKALKAQADEVELSLFLNSKGTFSYEEDGFEFTIRGVTKFIKWNDITSILGYKRDLFTYDEINLDIYTSSGISLNIKEEIPGWTKFTEQLKQRFPQINQSFEAELIFPPFETNLTLIYDFQNRNLEEILKE